MWQVTSNVTWITWKRKICIENIQLQSVVQRGPGRAEGHSCCSAAERPELCKNLLEILEDLTLTITSDSAPFWSHQPMEGERRVYVLGFKRYSSLVSLVNLFEAASCRRMRCKVLTLLYFMNVQREQRKKLPVLASFQLTCSDVFCLFICVETSIIPPIKLTWVTPCRNLLFERTMLAWDNKEDDCVFSVLFILLILLKSVIRCCLYTESK